MRITEITSDARKKIKYIQRLYSDYVINPSLYSELINAIEAGLQSPDSDVIQRSQLNQ